MASMIRFTDCRRIWPPRVFWRFRRWHCARCKERFYG